MKIKISLAPVRKQAPQTISAIKLIRDGGVTLLAAKHFIENVIDFHFNERRGVWIELPTVPRRFGHKLHDYGFLLMGLES